MAKTKNKSWLNERNLIQKKFKEREEQLAQVEKSLDSEEVKEQKRNEIIKIFSEEIDEAYIDNMVEIRKFIASRHIHDAYDLEKFEWKTHNEKAKKLIEWENAWTLAINLKNFKWLEKNIALDLIKFGYWPAVACNIENFVWINYIEMANLLIEKFCWEEVAFNIEKFKWVNHNDIANKLIECNNYYALAENLRKFKWLEKNIAENLIDHGYWKKVLGNIESFNWVNIKEIKNKIKKVNRKKRKNNIKSGAKKFLTAGLMMITLWTWFNIYQQKKVNRDHQTMDFIFDPEELSTEELLKYLVVTPEYNGKINRWLSQKWLTPYQITGSNFIFVSLKDHRTIDDKKEAIELLRKKTSKPILVSADFEWWYVHSFDEITDDDIEKYKIPQWIIDLRNEEASKNSRVSAFPSAEYLGKKYKDIVLYWRNEERLAFFKMMKEYWNSIRLIMEDIWVDIVYWPCVDIVPDFDWNTAIAKDDRSFGDSFVLWQDLISAFVWWFQDNNSHVLLVPKHYVWVWASESDPHKDIWCTDKNKDSWTETVFKNLINGKNEHLSKNGNENAINSFNKSMDKSKNTEYIKILEKNKDFITFLENNNTSIKEGESIKALMTTHASWLRWIDETITYSDYIISTMKSKIWSTQSKKMENWLVFSDDLAMEWANLWLPEWVDKTDINKIILALASWHDVVLDLDSHSEVEWNKIIWEVANQIESWCDIDWDWKTDITKDMLCKKVKKVLEILVKKWELQKTEDGKYMLTDVTYFDPNISKVLRDSYYSNQGLISWSWIEEYRAEWNWMRNIIVKKLKNMYERNIHNFPNVIRKLIRQDKEYSDALYWGKKLVIVDKSECKMFIFTIDWKKLLEEHDVWVWKGTDKLDYRYDRRILSDNKTPVWYYMIVDRRMWKEELLEKFSEDQLTRYWWENWWMLIMVWPRAPYVWIHWTQDTIWPSSNACVRVLDASERWENVDKSEQKAINHLNKILPNWTFVIITN